MSMADVDVQVRDIVGRRLVLRPLTDQEEAAACVRVLLDRGFTLGTIAERCGVDPGAVSHWKNGFSAPKGAARWARLATLARSALSTQRREDRLPPGMPRVVFAIMCAFDLPAYRVAERAGMKWPEQVGQRWLRGSVKPGRRATTRLRGLVHVHGLGDEFLAICDARLREIREGERRFSDQRLRRLADGALPSERQNSPEDSTMQHASPTAAPTGASG
jgi:transcriptional regulator with XRE-family HTH domain